jgi:hypothetical protein
MAVRQLGLIHDQDDPLPARPQPRQNLAAIGRHHRIDFDQVITQDPADPLVAHVQPFRGPRQRCRQIHQVRAPYLQHRRHQKRKSLALLLVLPGKTLAHIGTNALPDRLDPTHPSFSACQKGGILESHADSWRQEKFDGW